MNCGSKSYGFSHRVSVVREEDHITKKFKMKSFSTKLSFLIAILNCSAKNADSNIIARKMFDSWLNSQVFIHEKAFGWKDFIKFQIPKIDVFQQLPLCFGNLLTPKHVLTTIMCFKNVEVIAKEFDIKKKQTGLKNENWMTKYIYEPKAQADSHYRLSKYRDIDPKNFIVAKVSKKL